VFARSGRLTIKAPPEHLREYNDPSWHVPQVLQLSRKNPALFRKPSDSRVLCNSVHDFFDCLQILCESAFIWISEDCGTTGCGLRLRLKRPAPPIGEPRGALHLNPRPRSALLLLRPLSAGRFPSLRFRPKNMSQHIFQLESELQHSPEAAQSLAKLLCFPKNSPAMLLLRCPPLNTSPCWSAKSPSLWL
jgi:hypothetical protein